MIESTVVIARYAVLQLAPGQYISKATGVYYQQPGGSPSLNPVGGLPVGGSNSFIWIALAMGAALLLLSKGK